MNTSKVLVKSRSLPPGSSGELLSLPREQLNWELISFFVRRLAPGHRWEGKLEDEEAALVLFGGRCTVDWGKGAQRIGERETVFKGMPHAVYLPAGSSFQLTAETTCEIGECRAPSQGGFQPRVITPAGVEVEIRGGGNATRQINKIIQPNFPADRLMVVEVYTPSGNWSSYPPHKHDVHSPPDEVDLDEIYYYRISEPKGYAFQHLYTPDRRQDVVLTVADGNLVIVREGYHPVVAAHGCAVYYLNVLAGSARSMAARDDPDYAWVRDTWKEKDPRLPLVR